MWYKLIHSPRQDRLVVVSSPTPEEIVHGTIGSDVVDDGEEVLRLYNVRIHRVIQQSDMVTKLYIRNPKRRNYEITK